MRRRDASSPERPGQRPADQMYRNGAAPAGSAAGDGSAQELSPAAVNHILMDFLIYVGKTLVVFYPVYLTGYLGLSVSWVLLCMVMITWWKKNRRWKDDRIGTSLQFVDTETHVIKEELNKTLNMATWVNFPDVEKVDWLNKVLAQAWPFFGMFMEKLLKEKIQPSIRLSSAALKTFTFTKVHFGHEPLRITGMKVYTHEVDKREVILDMNISYEGDVDIDTEVKPPITAGVKGLQFQGTLRVILEPLIGHVPLVGGVTFFFIRRPTLLINWTGMTNLLDSPAFSQLSEETIMDIIASLMVLPNRMCIPLIDQVKVDQMRFPLPRGVVRVHLMEARDLLAKDTYMMGMVKGKSDPYAILRVGNRQFKSKTVKENLHPRWNEVYEFVVHEAPGQELEVELFDEDTDKDDFLGRYQIDFGEVKREKEMDQWFPLDGVQNGEVHMKLQWLSLQTDQSLLQENDDGCACAMLAVYLDNASNLPKDHSEFSHTHKHGKHSKEARLTRRTANPNSFVEVSIDEQIQKSKVVYASKDPVWEEGFTFFVHNIENQHLIVQVKEQGKKTLLGALNLPLSRLLNTSNMMLDQCFLLERSGANSQIKMKATLRIITVEKPPPKFLPPPQPKPRTLQTNQRGGPSTATPATSAPSSAPPASPTSPAHVTSPAPKVGPSNGFDGDYTAHRRDSFLASDGRRSVPATPHMRRFDSHSLLSENSITSSRFDLSDGAPYPDLAACPGCLPACHPMTAGVGSSIPATLRAG
ncbi:extended synaptotagmin-3 isoform X2 [Lampris incognitus]|uniref:extended synaptotagmin-3 isoform X2 n=1 Tax=Lampris incognitus TaxID=2546036 RepID=UPI0024B62317|nr:extended synaptotagmin-3 isoform X2 [Lampris incognitus]